MTAFSVAEILRSHRAELSARFDGLKRELDRINAEAEAIVAELGRCDAAIAAVDPAPGAETPKYRNPAIPKAGNPEPSKPPPAAQPSPIVGSGLSGLSGRPKGSEHGETGKEVAPPATPVAMPPRSRQKLPQGRKALAAAIAQLQPPVVMAMYAPIATEFKLTVQQVCKFHDNYRHAITELRQAPPKSDPPPPPSAGQGRGGQDKPFRGPAGSERERMIAAHIAAHGVTRAVDWGAHAEVVAVLKGEANDVAMLPQHKRQGKYRWLVNGGKFDDQGLYAMANRILVARGKPVLKMPKERVE